MKIGIMGGTFDPIHSGHLFIAENVREALSLDKIIFIPTGLPPHKNSNEISDKLHRFNMTKLAIEDNENFEISSIETDREDICYTVDTIKELDKIYKNKKYYYIVGADALADMHKWRNPKEIFENLSIVAVDRLQSRNDIKNVAENLRKEFGADITILNLPLIEFSSTDIRNRIINNQTVKYMIPNSVFEYAIKNNLYR